MTQSYHTHRINQAPKCSSVAVIVRESTKSDQLVLKYLLNYANKAIFPSHETISKATGFAVSTIKNALKRLRANGLLSWKQRWNDSCIYTLSEFVLLPKTLSWLRSYFIGFMSILLLSSYLVCKLDPWLLRYSKELILLKNRQSSSSDNATSYEAILNCQSLCTQNTPTGTWIYGSDDGPPNKKVTFEEFEAMMNNKEDAPMREKLIQDICNRIQLSDDDVDTLGRCADDVLKRVHGRIDSALSSNRPSAYFMKMVSNAITETPKRDARGFANKQTPPRRHIDQALLQPLSEEAKKRRADERREQWESKHGRKQNDAFYVPTRPTLPVDQPDRWYTPAWCESRLVEDLKILHSASKMDPNNQFLKFSLPVVIERIAQCEALLSGVSKKETTEPSKVTIEPVKQPSASAKSVVKQYAVEQQDMFDSLSGSELDYSELEEIL